MTGSGFLLTWYHAKAINYQNCKANILYSKPRKIGFVAFLQNKKRYKEKPHEYWDFDRSAKKL